MMRGRRLLAAALLLSSICALPAQEPPLYRVTSLIVPLSRYADRSKMLGALVTRVIDGDTIEVEIDRPLTGIDRKEKVRLIGVDTPELKDRDKTVREFAQAASEYVKGRLLGARVFLAFDTNLRDVYRRLLAYVYTEDGTCFNRELVAEGYGFAYVKYPFFFMDEFRNVELSARYGRKGLWGQR